GAGGEAEVALERARLVAVRLGLLLEVDAVGGGGEEVAAGAVDDARRAPVVVVAGEDADEGEQAIGRGLRRGGGRGVGASGEERGQEGEGRGQDGAGAVGRVVRKHDARLEGRGAVRVPWPGNADGRPRSERDRP